MSFWKSSAPTRRPIDSILKIKRAQDGKLKALVRHMCKCVKGKLQQCFRKLTDTFCLPFPALNLLIKCIIYPGHSLIDWKWHINLPKRSGESSTWSMVSVGESRAACQLCSIACYTELIFTSPIQIFGSLKWKMQFQLTGCTNPAE